MANFGDLIGAFMQSAMAPSGQQRAGNALEDLVRTGLGSLGGGAQGGQAPGGVAPAGHPGAQPGGMGGLGDMLGQILGGAQAQGGPAGQAAGGVAPAGHPGAQPGGMGGLGDMLGQILGGAQAQGGPAGQAGGMGDLGGILGQVFGAVQGGLSNAAQHPGQAGGLGAIVGGLLGGGGDSVKGALGGGALAMLASIAFKAMQGAGQTGAGGGVDMPGLMVPQTPAQAQVVESAAQLVLKGMINASKADGKIDPTEMQRIVGKLQESGMDDQTRAWVLNEMGQPLDLDAFAAEIPGQEVAAQVYTASLLAIEIDTDGERAYLAELAQKTGLHPMVAEHIQQSMGVTV
jgi:uncharacterized membrane protein YebE (DUF533 family)